MHLKAALGLGNPGSKYQNTYHSVGHLMADFLLKKNILPTKVIIAKNDGYMNEAGTSAMNLLKKTKIKSENLLVIHDDSDIVIGKFKVSFGRGSAGHKGINDIIKKIGSKNFWRLRIGVRPTSLADNADKKQITQTKFRGVRISQQSPRLRAGEFVLKKIKKEHQEILNKVFEEAVLVLASTN